MRAVADECVFFFFWISLALQQCDANRGRDIVVSVQRVHLQTERTDTRCGYCYRCSRRRGGAGTTSVCCIHRVISSLYALLYAFVGVALRVFYCNKLSLHYWSITFFFFFLTIFVETRIRYIFVVVCHVSAVHTCERLLYECVIDVWNDCTNEIPVSLNRYHTYGRRVVIYVQ